MAAVLVKETGAGLQNSNAYEDITGADAYHETHTFGAATWAAATPDQKTVALIMAARLLDQHIDWDGTKKTLDQAMEWPRYDVYDRSGWLLPSDVIPAWLRNANAEMARHLLPVAEDRTADQAVGLSELKVDVITLKFDKYDRAGVLPDSVMAFVRPYGGAAGGHSVLLERV